MTAVSEAAQWKLGRGSAGGYKLLSAGNTSRSLSQSGTNAVLSAESGSTGQNWIFESAAAPSGILIYNAPPSWLAPEESSKVVVAVYSPYSNNQTVTWSTGDSSVAAVSSTGVLTGKGPGSTTLTLGPNSAHRIGNKQFTINVTAVANGRYYIQNRYYDSLLQPDDGGASHMEQFSADGQADQKWYLERYDEDCYRIRNLGSNLYLTSPNTAAQDEAIVQAEYSAAAAERQLWRFVPTTEGSYKIQSRAMEENALVMAIGWALMPSSGVNVEQRQYTADTDYGDEWRITPYHHRLNLEVYVDQAYKTRYPEYQQRILENLTGVQEKVLEAFGIYVDFTDPIDYWSLGDECDSLSGGDYNSPCTHGICENSSYDLDGTADKTTHHKNIYNILYNTPVPDLSQTARIVFSGHTICAVTSQGHEYDSIKGVCLVNKGLCIIANHDGKVAESRTTLHEIMHWYGAPDHYEKSIPEELESEFQDLCLYGWYKQNFSNIDEVVFCPGCLEKIYQNLDKFDH